MKNTAYSDIVKMFNAINREHDGEILILDCTTGDLRYVRKDKFNSVGTLEVGYVHEEEAEND